MLGPRAQVGFTLVEVMVTVFVVAIGLLTAAGLQAVSKKAAFDAIQRTTATVLAQDMLERIRSNPLQVSHYAPTEIYQGKEPIASTCSSSASCTQALLVGYDLAQWWQSLDGASETIADGTGSAYSGGLRSPAGCIRYSGGNLVEVIVTWRGMSQITQASDGNVDDPTNDTCGDAISDYEKNGTQSFRRLLRLQAHVQQPPITP